MSKGCMFCPRSLHYDFAGHLRMNRAEVGISSRFAEGEGELLVRVEHFGLEDLRIVRADHGVRDVIAIRPCDCGSYRHSSYGGPEAEVIDLNFHHRRLLLFA